MVDRSRIKSSAYSTHMPWNGTGAICPWCNNWIDRNCFDAHEALVKRSNVPKSKQDLIFVVENVVPLHVACHSQYGQTLKMKKRCLAAICRRVTATRVGRWYRSLIEKHEISLPAGILLPRNKIKTYSYEPYFDIGRNLMNVDVDGDEWDIDLLGRTWDYRAAVWATWAKNRGHSKLKPPKEMNGVTSVTMMKMYEEAYWFTYMTGVCGVEC